MLIHCLLFRAALATFLEDEVTKRLLVYVDGKDLGAVSGLCCMTLPDAHIEGL